MTVPGIFLSHDGYLDAAIFCLRQYASHWTGCPINFLVPANSAKAAERLRLEAPENLSIEVVRSGLPIKETLEALDQAAGDAEWVFWCSSDRYPILAVPESLNAIAAEISGNGNCDALAAFGAIRVVRWKDAATIPADARQISIGSETFRHNPTPRVGFWHPQFVRRSWLKSLIASLAADADLEAVQAAIAAMKIQAPQNPLICDRPLMKLEEPIRCGLATINYEARLARRGAPMSGLKIEGATVAYSCLGAHQANLYWEKAVIDPASRVTRPLPGRAAFRVFSTGGVGSKRIATWLLGDVSPDVRSNAHSHWRIPPTQLGAGERCIYVFGDPRNAVLSVFNRRMVRHEGHGYADVNPVRDRPAPDFAMVHAVNLEADPGNMTAEWDLRTYLRKQQDIFRLEEHFDFWLSADAPYETVFVRYETLWRHTAELSGYLGAKGKPPEFRERTSNWLSLEPDQRERIDKLHGSFARRLEQMPDVFRVQDGRASLLDGSALAFAAI